MEFYDFVAISLCGGKDYFCKKSIFSCGYSVKEQTWLAIYVWRRPLKAKVWTASFILTFNTISKRQALPCLFIYDFPPISHAGVNGQTKYRLHHFSHSLTVKMENG